MLQLSGRDVNSPGDPAAERILDAALAQFEDFGLRRSTIEDVARRAGISRITVHRRFGTKDALLQAVVVREVERFFDALEAAVSGFADFADRLAEGFAFALDYMRGHGLLNRLLRTEPEALLPYLTTSGDAVLVTARSHLADRLGRDVLQGRLPPGDIAVMAELLTRLTFSFLITPETAARLVTTDDARRFARRYLVPVVEAQARATAGTLSPRH
jgi:AcrR family transcriptional regulator